MSVGVVTQHPALRNADLCLLLEEEQRILRQLYNHAPDTELARYGIRCWQLAPDIPTYQALMRGESVPLSKLNPDAVRRYGLR